MTMIRRVAAISDIHGNLPPGAPTYEQLLDPPDPDETTAHFESVRGA